MVDVDKAVIVRLKTHGNIFEILVDCNKALAFKEGKKVQLSDVLATNQIYKDVKKGQLASENELKRIFDTSDQLKISEIILKTGNIPLTADYKSKLREEKLNKIVDIIHRNAVDSKTGLPHPSKRIKDAIIQAKIKVDENKSAEQQIDYVIEALVSLLPIKIETKDMEIKIPANYAGKSYSILKKYGKVTNDEWLNDGSLKVRIQIPGGLQDDFFSEINNLTRGNVEIKIEKK